MPFGYFSYLIVAALGASLVWLWLRHKFARRLDALRRAAEQSNADLRRSEAKYRVISEYSRDALSAIAPPDWRFVSVNRAALELYGVADEATLLTMGPGDISPEMQPDGTPSADAARIQIQKAMSEGYADFDWTHRTPAGKIIPCRVQLARFELDGQVLIQGTVRDMTDVRAAEERNRALQAQVQEAQKLEAVGRLAGGVAHDFNNMLAIISLQAELALVLLESGRLPREQLEQIVQVTERTAALVQQLLAFSRRQSVAPRSLNLDVAVNASLNLLRPGLDEGMQLGWRPGAGNWHVRLDPVQVDQILTNLCSNARDACNGQGRIVISTQQVHLAAADCAGLIGLQPGAHVLLSVEDDGPGLSETAQAHVFEPFFTTKEVGRGTGLGLASVYGIVRQAHGDAKAESQAGRGARFILYFPRHEESDESSAPVAPDRPAAATARVPGVAFRGRILLVEDQPELLLIFREGLERAGYRVRAFAGPMAALAAADEPGFGFDLLLSDVVMPGMNGLRMAQELRARYPDLRALFMSGYSAGAMQERGLDIQGARILSKPFLMSDLLTAVQAILQERQS
jgi:PAS domain S-box-containing protein